MMKRLPLAPLALLICSAFVACGGGDSPDPGQSATPPVADGTFTLPPIDPSVELSTFESELLPYAIGVPDTWTHEPANGGGDRFYVNREGGPLLSELIVRCTTTIRGDLTDAQSLMDEDLELLSVSPIRTSTPIIQDLEAKDRPGKMMVYGHASVGVPITIMVAYFGDEKCGWRVRMNTFGPGATEQYVALFQRIAATLDPSGDLASSGVAD
jgi:hypothetical protein